MQLSRVEKQVHVAPDEGGKFISQADFVIKGTRIAIYVDGAAFHQGSRLRRDRNIRRRLEEGSYGWTVVELTAKDLKQGENLIAELKASNRT